MGAIKNSLVHPLLVRLAQKIRELVVTEAYVSCSEYFHIFSQYS